MRGVAGGKVVPLIGAVVLSVKMCKKGKNEGPDIKARFKITARGATDWVGMILGGKAIDHPSRGGLGHCPCGDGHWMAELGVMMDRIDQCMAGPPKGGIFGIQLVKGSFDSDDEAPSL